MIYARVYVSLKVPKGDGLGNEDTERSGVHDEE